MLPETAPFPAVRSSHRTGSSRAAAQNSALWLSGFLAGYQAANVLRNLPPPCHQPAGAVDDPVGTDPGNAEALADVARKAAGKLGFAARVLDMADATPDANRQHTEPAGNRVDRARATPRSARPIFSPR